MNGARLAPTAEHWRTRREPFDTRPSTVSSGVITILLICALLQPNALPADPVAVRHTEGLMHGFLVLQTLDGKPIADGQLTQDAHGDRVVDHLIFRFKDGSIYQDTTVFSQHQTFRLVSDHLIQRGPSFDRSLDMTIDASAGQVTIHTESDGRQKVMTQRMGLPPDLANGLLFTLLKDIQPTVPRTTVSMLTSTPEPRLVKLAILPQSEAPFSIGRFAHKARHYVVRVEIGGISGWLAHLLGKQPSDMHAWVLEGEAPAFVKFEGALYTGGPIWRIQLASAGLF
jgi:hypothetical protein